jgi:hypothetical protein
MRRWASVPALHGAVKRTLGVTAPLRHKKAKAGVDLARSRPSGHAGSIPPWPCPRCRMQNYWDKPTCFACKTPCPNLPKSLATNTRVLEWRCPRCRGRNTDTNVGVTGYCHNCKAPRPGIVDLSWGCIKCFHRNESTHRQKQCAKCGAPQPVEA